MSTSLGGTRSARIERTRWRAVLGRLASTASQGGGLSQRRSGGRSGSGPALLRRGIVLILSAALLAGPPSSAAAASATKRKPKNALEDIDRVGDRNVTGILNLFSMRQEVRLGKQFSDRISRQAVLVKDPLVTEFVNRIGQNLVRNSDVKVPVEIRVIRDDTVNAFALPGGFFYVNSGLIVFARDEAELAGVMGHEIAHIAGRHGTRQASRAQLTSMTAEILIRTYGGYNTGTAVAIIAANIALPLTFLKFSRTFEKKADFLGMQYLYKTGYDPLSMVAFFERLSAMDKRRKGFISNAFRSHPLSAKRVVRVQKSIDELLPERPQYAVSSTEFDRVKARLIQLYGDPAESSSDSSKPKIERRR